MKIHTYSTEVIWTGNSGNGTKDYRSYSRSHKIKSKNKPVIQGSSDPTFLGDSAKYNPEELFLASLSSCHMLWYLHLCSENNVVVTSYCDEPIGTMREEKSGTGYFEVVVLKPKVTISEPVRKALARTLHQEAGRKCFIANSCNFPVKHEPAIFISE
jgi:organic hydroperoxide reductase OsmC/OhrA